MPPRVAPTPSSSSGISSRSTRSSPPGGGFDLELVEEREGFVAARVSGKGAFELFKHETGGHRWQRVPPTEKRDRVHTSTVTVALLLEPTSNELRIADKDLEWSTCRSSGAGGQHVNKTESAVQLKHLPTGIMVRCEAARSQHANREAALGVLRARIQAQREATAQEARAADRRAQVGSGMRGDKRRTIRKDGVVDVDGRTWRYEDYIRGRW